MKIVRKNRRGIRIEHNKKLFWIIILLIILLILVIFSIVRNNKEKAVSQNSQNPNPECSANEDCVPNKCCHATECVLAESLLAPVCKDTICSMVCSGPLDCGAGSCGCVKGKCLVVPSG